MRAINYVYLEIMHNYQLLFHFHAMHLDWECDLVLKLKWLPRRLKGVAFRSLLNKLFADAATKGMAQQAKKKRKESGKEKVACSCMGKPGECREKRFRLKCGCVIVWRVNPCGFVTVPVPGASSERLTSRSTCKVARCEQPYS